MATNNTNQVPFTCDNALKEWAVAIEALSQGMLALIIRKGGIREDNNRFEVKFPEFLFFPSFEHQQSDLLRPEHAANLTDALAAEPDIHNPDNGPLKFSAFAQVHSAFPVTELAQLEALSDHHIWTQEYAEKRLRWKPKVALTAMILRVYRLPETKQVLFRSEYVGCKSWLPLLDSVTVDALEPAMTDQAFAAEAAAIQAAMESAKAAV
jgi:hypothetical protein